MVAGFTFSKAFNRFPGLTLTNARSRQGNGLSDLLGLLMGGDFLEIINIIFLTPRGFHYQAEFIQCFLNKFCSIKTAIKARIVLT